MRRLATHGDRAGDPEETVPKDHNLVFITHQFPTVEQAEAFTADPDLHSAMACGGVVGDPGIELFEDIT